MRTVFAFRPGRRLKLRTYLMRSFFCDILIKMMSFVSSERVLSSLCSDWQQNKHNEPGILIHYVCVDHALVQIIERAY
jgi:hypothetical protein